MHWIRSFVWVSVVLLLWSCNTKEDEAKKVVRAWYGKNISIPSSLEAKIYGKDTSILSTELLNKPYNVLIFIDTTGCTECNMHLHDWHLLMEEVKQYDDRINFIFVVHASNFDEVSAFAIKNKFNHPLFYDYENAFAEANKHLPKQTEYQTFLVDKNGKVILVGNPVKNKSLWRLYKKQMEIYEDGIDS